MSFTLLIIILYIVLSIMVISTNGVIKSIYIKRIFDFYLFFEIDRK